MPAKTVKSYQLVVIAIILLIMALTLFNTLKDKKQSINPYASMGGDFVLQSSNGKVSLKDYRGKAVVLYFGYASCPDVCPTSLGLLSLALNKLSKEELDKLAVFFISVDPERDTPEKLEKYGKAFHEKITGITGTPQQLAELARRYGVAYMKVETPGSAMGYTVDHSSRYYLLDRSGQLVALVEHGRSPQEIVDAIRPLL